MKTQGLRNFRSPCFWYKYFKGKFAKEVSYMDIR